MSKTAIKLIIGSIVVFGLIYFGLDTIPSKTKDLEKSRLTNIESTSVTNLIREASKSLNDNQKSFIEALELDLDKVGTDTIKRIKVLQSISGAWFELGYPAIAGAYAEDVAKLAKDEKSWSMAGTTFALCVKRDSIDAKEKEFCSKHAIQAFEKAISISPNNLDNRINLAICYVDNPLPDNPMQGILMLRELNTKNPENVAVLNQLGKLAIQTGQMERAIERLENAYKLEPRNKMTLCLLADAYTQSGNEAKSKEFRDKCNQ
jgi:tetratricopeptide (TPR) repeat protein